MMILLKDFMLPVHSGQSIDRNRISMDKKFVLLVTTVRKNQC